MNVRDVGSVLTTAIHRQASIFRGENLGQAGLGILVIFVLLGLAGPWVTPYDPDTMHRHDDGSIKRLEPPSTEHVLGTTRFGRDVLSQVIVSTRTTLIVGSLAAFISVLIGTNIGLISGYFGGWIDDLLMRLTDIVYGLPFLPFVIALVAILGPDLYNLIAVISLILWRGTARVIRSQVLQIKERPYIEAAEASGAGHLRVMFIHILPNVFPIIFLYGAFTVAWTIIAEASISFLGFGDPELYSWGKMIFAAYTANVIRQAWWWVFPPGISIMLFVMAVFFIGRAYEKVAVPALRDEA